jgi:hypothetical protein
MMRIGGRVVPMVTLRSHSRIWLSLGEDDHTPASVMTKFVTGPLCAGTLATKSPLCVSCVCRGMISFPANDENEASHGLATYPRVPDAHGAVLAAGPEHDRLVVVAVVAVVLALGHQQARDAHAPVLLQLGRARAPN